ncbi:MAG: hypothetical protein ACRDDC_00225 [Tannerellaceae bacterium]
MRDTDELVRLYGESFNLITKTPNLTTDKIPQNLLDAWTSDDVIFVTENVQQRFSFAIFELIHDLYEDTDLTNLSILKSRYDAFQNILIHELINRYVNINLHPVKLFDISSYTSSLIMDIRHEDVEMYNHLVNKYSNF